MGYGQWGHESDTAEWAHTCAHTHTGAHGKHSGLSPSQREPLMEQFAIITL